MRPLRQYRSIEFHHVCAIARAVLVRDPAISDAEWKAAVLETCARQGWDNPPSDMLARALSAVEQAVAKTLGPRPVHGAIAPSPVAPSLPPLSQADAAAMLRRLGATVKSMPNVRLRTLREVECHKAAALVAQAIVEQIQRCEEAERVANEAAAPQPEEIAK